MNRKILSGTSLMLMMGVVILTLNLTRTYASTETVLYIEPSSVVDPSLAPGDTFTVDVVISDVEYLYTWQVNMSFDPTVLKIIDILEGDFLKSQPEGTYGAQKIRKSSVLFGWSTKGIFVGVSGSGTLATVEFEVLAEGESLLKFETDPVYIEETGTWVYPTFLIQQFSPVGLPMWNDLYPPEDFTTQNGYFNNFGAVPPIPTTIDELKTEIEELYSTDEIDNRGIVRSLLAKLNVAQKLAGKGKIAEAKSILEEDFIPQVQNLSDIHITRDATELLIESAECIISNL